MTTERNDTDLVICATLRTLRSSLGCLCQLGNASCGIEALVAVLGTSVLLMACRGIDSHFNKLQRVLPGMVVWMFLNSLRRSLRTRRVFCQLACGRPSLENRCSTTCQQMPFASTLKCITVAICVWRSALTMGWIGCYLHSRWPSLQLHHDSHHSVKAMWLAKSSHAHRLIALYGACTSSCIHATTQISLSLETPHGFVD